MCGGLPGECGVSSAVCLAPVTDDWRVVQSLAQPSPLSMTAAALGLGLLSAATAVTRPPPLPQPPSGQEVGSGRWPVVPEAPLQHVSVCLAVHHSFLVPERGLEG